MSLSAEERQARDARVRARQARALENLRSSSEEVDTKAIVFHIGAHKTASSFLQTLLKVHARALGEQGYSVVHRNHMLSSPLQDALIAIGKGQQPSPELRIAAARALHGLLSTRKPNVLFSSEDMLHRIRDLGFFAHAGKAVEFLRQLVGAIPIRVVLYTRTQPDYVESVYMQFMHLGRDFTFAEFRERMAGSDYSWKRVLDEIAAVIGTENVTAVPYESIKRVGSEGFYRHFLKTWGVPHPEAFSIPTETENSRGANRSYSADALKIARFVGPMIDEEQRKKLRKFLQENFSTATHAKAVLFTPEERRALLEATAQDNAALFDTWLKDWPEERKFYA